MQLNSAGLVSAQMHVQTWGQMGAGDFVALELWRYNGAPEMTISHNFANDLPSTTPGQWSNISWDPTDQLGGHSWSYGVISNQMVLERQVECMLMISYYSQSKRLMSSQSMLIVTTQLVDTLLLQTTFSQCIVLLLTMVTKLLKLRIKSNVSNESWMNPSLPMIRIDSANPTQHGVDVIIPPIPAGNTTEMWINLSIPAGSDVQQQVWQVWWEDAGGTQLGEMGRVTADLAVTEQYGVQLSSTAPLLAGSVLPGESMSIPFKLQNAGNREAGYTITSNFQGEGWVAYVTDENHSIVQMPIPLAKGESVNLLLNVTSPDRALPGRSAVLNEGCLSIVWWITIRNGCNFKENRGSSTNSFGNGCRRIRNYGSSKW